MSESAVIIPESGLVMIMETDQPTLEHDKMSNLVFFVPREDDPT